jgi:hypothetical protein
MKLNNFNNNIKPVGLNYLALIKENIPIFSCLILSILLNIILISFCFDTFINNFDQLTREYCFLKENIICPINFENTNFLYIKQDSGNKGSSIFNSFIDLFNKDYSKCRYFPSYFQTFTNHTDSILINKFVTLPCINETRMDLRNLVIAKEVVSYNQYLILEGQNNHLNALLNDLCNILLEYKQRNSL